MRERAASIPHARETLNAPWKPARLYLHVLSRWEESYRAFPVVGIASLDPWHQRRVIARKTDEFPRRTSLSRRTLSITLIQLQRSFKFNFHQTRKRGTYGIDRNFGGFKVVHLSLRWTTDNDNHVVFYSYIGILLFNIFLYRWTEIGGCLKILVKDVFIYNCYCCEAWKRILCCC